MMETRWIACPKVISTPFQTAVKNIYYHHFSFQPLLSPILKEMFFRPCRKVFDFRFCPMYITVTSGSSVLEWTWLSAKCSRVLKEVIVGFRERNSSFTFRKCARIILFPTETSEQQKGRLLAVVTFCLFLSTRFVSTESSPGMITANIEQHI